VPSIAVHALFGWVGMVRAFIDPIPIHTHLKTKTMSTATADKLKGNWNELKGKLKQKYAQLTDDDLTYAEGKEDELYGKMQQRLGQTKDQVRDLVQDVRTEFENSQKKS